MTLVLTLVAAAIPPLFLTGFLLTHFRHRLGVGLGIQSVIGGMICVQILRAR